MLWLTGLFASYIAVLAMVAVFPSLQRYIPNLKNVTGGFGYSLLRFEDLEGVTEVDVLFLGSSHANQGFDVEFFADNSIDSFNLGSTAQTPLNSYFILKEFIDEIDIKLLVFETYWAVATNETGVESTIDISSNYAITRNIFEMALKSNNWLAINSTIGNLVRQTFLHDPLNVNLQESYERDTYVARGFMYTERVARPKVVEKGVSKREVFFSDKQLGYIEKIVQLAQENKIDIIFIRTPVTDELKGAVVDYPKTMDIYNKVADRYGIRSVDFNDARYTDVMKLEYEKHFYNPSHMNKLGVNIFSKQLLPVLIEELN